MAMMARGFALLLVLCSGLVASVPQSHRSYPSHGGHVPHRVSSHVPKHVPSRPTYSHGHHGHGQGHGHSQGHRHGPYCAKPLIYHDNGTYQDTNDWWTTFNEQLPAEHCAQLFFGHSPYKCSHFAYYPSYRAVVHYLKGVCITNVEKVASLRTAIEDFCRAVPNTNYYRKHAYWCKSGCDLADHLNQLCTDIISQPPTVPTPTLQCPANATLFDNTASCYTVSEDFTSWFKAMMLCESKGQRMVRIDSQEENDFVKDFILNNTLFDDNRPWIGLNDVIEEGTFRWSGYADLAPGLPGPYTGPPYLNWPQSQRGFPPGGPSSRNPNYDYVFMRLNGDWNDARPGNGPPRRMRQSVCEFPASVGFTLE